MSFTFTFGEQTKPGPVAWHECELSKKLGYSIRRWAVGEDWLIDDSVEGINCIHYCPLCGVPLPEILPELTRPPERQPCEGCGEMTSNTYCSVMCRERMKKRRYRAKMAR